METERSVANIMWHSGSANVYRLGHKGKADLKYKTAASGGNYYRDHLPVLGTLANLYLLFIIHTGLLIFYFLKKFIIFSVNVCI